MTAKEYFYIVCENRGVNEYVNLIYEQMKNEKSAILPFCIRSNNQILFSDYDYVLKRFFQDGFILIKERNHGKDRYRSYPDSGYENQPDWFFYVDIYNEKENKHIDILKENKLQKF